MSPAPLSGVGRCCPGWFRQGQCWFCPVPPTCPKPQPPRDTDSVAPLHISLCLWGNLLPGTPSIQPCGPRLCSTMWGMWAGLKTTGPGSGPGNLGNSVSGSRGCVLPPLSIPAPSWARDVWRQGRWTFMRHLPRPHLPERQPGRMKPEQPDPSTPQSHPRDRILGE